MKRTGRPGSPLLIAAVQLGLLLFAIYYTFIGGQTAQGIYDPAWRLMTLWLVTLLAGGWLVSRLVDRAGLPRTPLDGPLVLLLAAWVLATIFSVNVTYSREALVFFVTYLFFFYMAADASQRPWLTELVLNAILATSGLVWTLALLQLSWWYQALPAPAPDTVPPLSFLQNLPRLTVLGNPNTMASYIALIMPLALYKLMTARQRITRGLVALWVVLLAGAILLTQSRGGLLALVTGVSLYLGIAAWQKKGGASLSLRPGRAGLAALAVLSAFGLLTLVMLAWRGASEGVGIRRQVMMGALAAWAGRPLLGVGPGALGEALLRYQQPLDVIWADAHNLYLTLAAETGLLGAAGLAWLVGTGLYLAWGGLRRVDRARWPLVSAACGAALAGFGVHNLVDSLFKYPLVMLLVAVLAGLGLGPFLANGLLPTTSLYRPGRWGYPVTLAAGLLLAANAWLGLAGLRNIELYNQAVAAAGGGDWSAAAGYLQQADRAAPGVPFYQRELGFALGYVSQEEPAQRPAAIAHYQTALQHIDRLAVDHANLGCLLAADGQAAAAGQELALAQELEPANPVYRLNLGYWLEQTGQEQAAWEQYVRVLASQPGFLPAAFWQQNERRTAALPVLLQEAAAYLLQADPPLWTQAVRLYLAAGQPEEALHIYQANEGGEQVDPASLHLLKGQILLALERSGPAQDEFQAALRLNPGVSEAHRALSQMALAAGHLELAGAHSAQALFLEQSPENLYQAGLVAEARGELATALERYEAAFNGLTVTVDPNLTRYATEVARRRPMPAVFLPCLIRLYPAQLLIQITQAEGRLLESQGQVRQAGRVYRRLLAYEPAAPAVETQLAMLCRGHPETCQP